MGARRALPRVMSASWVVMTYREVSSILSEDARLHALTLYVASNPISPPCYSQESPIIELLHTLVDYP